MRSTPAPRRGFTSFLSNVALRSMAALTGTAPSLDHGYRRPSLNTLLGITKAKKEIKKELGITKAMKPFRWWTNTKRRLKRKVGYESDAGRLIRNGLRRPGGCLVVMIIVSMALTVSAAVVMR